MGRKKVDKVVEHRITFGDLERRELKQTLDAYQYQQKIKNYTETGRIVLVGGAIAGVGYLGVVTWRAINDLLEWDWWQDTKDAVGGFLDSVGDAVVAAAKTTADVVVKTGDIVTAPLNPIISTGIDTYNVTVPEVLQVDPTTAQRIEEQGLFSAAVDSATDEIGGYIHHYYWNYLNRPEHWGVTGWRI